MRTCHCRRCDARFVIGHPEANFRQRAREIAQESHSWIQRLTGHARRRARAIEAELIRDFYAQDPQRLRELPARCPHCHHRGEGGLPWWDPGISTT